MLRNGLTGSKLQAGQSISPESLFRLSGGSCPAVITVLDLISGLCCATFPNQLQSPEISCMLCPRSFQFSLDLDLPPGDLDSTLFYKGIFSEASSSSFCFFVLDYSHLRMLYFQVDNEGTLPYVCTLSILSHCFLSCRLPQNNEQTSLGYTVIHVGYLCI